ncbi:MAG: restriction endonuclease [Solirubrobacterales bacterium]
MISTLDLLKATFSGLSVTWPIWALIALVVIGKFIFRIWEKKRLAESGIDQIDGMSGKTFEKYLEVLFTKLGYKVERTQYIGDYGADLITSKNGVKTVIQAKRYKNKVGIKAVQEAVAAKGKYGCTKAMVVTNSFYTNQAIELAKANAVELWNRDDLVRALLSVKDTPAPLPAKAEAEVVPLPQVHEMQPEASEPEAAATEEPTQAVCAHCGKPVSEKVLQYCLDNEKRFGGAIYCYEHQRKR